MREHYHSMYKMAYKWCGHRETAQDVVQDACIKVARHIGGFRFQSSFSSWFYRIVINTARDHLKQNKRTVRLLPLLESESMTDAHCDPGEQLHAWQILQRVQGLPEREKTALLLVFGEGLNHREAAVVMQCKESTVSGYVHQARKKLAAFADREYAGEERHG